MIVVAVAAALLAVASVAAFFGNLWWVLDLVANFRPHLVVALVVSGVWLLIGRWRRTGWAVLAAAAVNAAVVAPLFLAPSVSAAPTADSLRVLSFNVLAANTHYDEVIEFIRQSDADVVFLHEASRPWEKAVAEASLGYRITTNRTGDRIFATLVLTRGVAEVEGFGFGENEPRSVEVIVTTADGYRVSILGVHPLAPVTALSSAYRNAQLGFAADWARTTEGRRIVVGDFNASPWSYAFRHLTAEGRLHNSQRGYGLELSFPTTTNLLLRLPIDHLLYSDGLTVVDRRLGPSLGSDHLPLTVDLAVTEPR